MFRIWIFLSILWLLDLGYGIDYYEAYPEDEEEEVPYDGDDDETSIGEEKRCYVKDLKLRQGLSDIAQEFQEHNEFLDIACVAGFEPTHHRPFCFHGKWMQKYDPCGPMRTAAPTEEPVIIEKQAIKPEPVTEKTVDDKADKANEEPKNFAVNNVQNVPMFDQLHPDLLSKIRVSFQNFGQTAGNCGHPDNPAHGVVTVLHYMVFTSGNSKTETKSDLHYSCNEGYILTPIDQTRTCLEDGTWSGNAPHCKRKDGSETEEAEMPAGQNVRLSENDRRHIMKLAGEALAQTIKNHPVMGDLEKYLRPQNK